MFIVQTNKEGPIDMPALLTPTPQPAPVQIARDHSRPLSDARLSAVVQAAYVLEAVGR